MSLTWMLADFGWQNVTQADGLAISITGMLIVFVALVGISLFIGLLPMLLKVLGPWLPDPHGHAPTHAAAESSSDDPRIIAAIGFAKHMQAKRQGGGK